MFVNIHVYVLLRQQVRARATEKQRFSEFFSSSYFDEKVNC